MSPDDSGPDKKPDRTIPVAVITTCGTIVVALIGAAALLLSRSGGSSANPAPTETTPSSAAVSTHSPSAAPTPGSLSTCGNPISGVTEQLVFCDNFSSHRNGWSDVNDPGSAYGRYVSGGYVVGAADDGSVQVGVPTTAPQNLGDVSALNVAVSVRADLQGGSGGQYGLLCRGGPGDGFKGKGYGFAVQGDLAVIDKFEFNGNTTLHSQLAASGPLTVHTGLNLLQASCVTVGDQVQLTFWVNGTKVAQYTDKDNPFTSGYVGVYTFMGASAKFEDFSAYGA